MPETLIRTHPKNRTKMVFIEACLGPVGLVRSSSTRSSGQNWTPSTIQTPSRPGSRRTKLAGRKLAGEDPPWHRPLRAQTFTSCQNSQNPPNTQTAPIIISPSLEGGPPYDPPSLTGQFWHANRSSPLSLAKTGGKLLDWPGGMVTSCGALSSCHGI